jgi:hypothetical protein
MKMTIEDYITKQRDITYLKLTREVQEVSYFACDFYFAKCINDKFITKFLGTIDYDGKKLKEAAILEQTIAYQNKVLFFNEHSNTDFFLSKIKIYIYLFKGS